MLLGRELHGRLQSAVEERMVKRKAYHSVTAKAMDRNGERRRIVCIAFCVRLRIA